MYIVYCMRKRRKQIHRGTRGLRRLAFKNVGSSQRPVLSQTYGAGQTVGQRNYYENSSGYLYLISRLSALCCPDVYEPISTCCLLCTFENLRTTRAVRGRYITPIHSDV